MYFINGLSQREAQNNVKTLKELQERPRENNYFMATFT